MAAAGPVSGPATTCWCASGDRWANEGSHDRPVAPLVIKVRPPWHSDSFVSVKWNRLIAAAGAGLIEIGSVMFWEPIGRQLPEAELKQVI